MKPPRVIRKVTKFDARSGRPKVATDRKAQIRVERVKAARPRPCNNRSVCLQGGLIFDGVEYAKIEYLTRRRGGYRQSRPETADYHFECLPHEAQPLVRFFRVT